MTSTESATMSTNAAAICEAKLAAAREIAFHLLRAQTRAEAVDTTGGGGGFDGLTLCSADVGESQPRR